MQQYNIENISKRISSLESKVHILESQCRFQDELIKNIKKDLDIQFVNKGRALSLSDLKEPENTSSQKNDWRKKYPNIKITGDEGFDLGRSISVGTLNDMGISGECNGAYYFKDDDLIPIEDEITVSRSIQVGAMIDMGIPLQCDESIYSDFEEKEEDFSFKINRTLSVEPVIIDILDIPEEKREEYKKKTANFWNLGKK
jgi:hypothetical protein